MISNVFSRHFRTQLCSAELFLASVSCRWGKHITIRFNVNTHKQQQNKPNRAEQHWLRHWSSQIEHKKQVLGWRWVAKRHAENGRRINRLKAWKKKKRSADGMYGRESAAVGWAWPHERTPCSVSLKWITGFSREGGNSYKTNVL